MKKFLILLVVVVFAASMAYLGIGCKAVEPLEEAVEETEEAIEEEAEEEVVAEEEELYIFPGATWSSAFWQECAYGALMAGEEIGATVEIVGPSDMDADALLAAFEAAANRMPTGIITFPWETGEAEILTEYVNNGGMVGGWWAHTDSYPYHTVALNDVELLARDMLDKAIEAHGSDSFKLGIGGLIGQAFHETLYQVTVDEVTANYPNIEVVGALIDQGMSAEEATANANAYVSANPDVDVYIINASMLGSPIARAVGEAGFGPGEKTIVYSYFSPEIVADFESGYLQGTMANPPSVQCYWAVKMLHTLVEGKGKVTVDSDAKYGYNILPYEMIMRTYWIDSAEAAKDFVVPMYDF